MSKSITIPTDRGSRIIVDINGVEYVYAAGATVTVPDEVAAAIEDALANAPSGTRTSETDEMLSGLTARVAALEEGGGGSDLPEVTAEDNGDVLTVVDGAWAKAAPTGGGVLVVHAVNGTLDKTWQEIHDAPFSVLTDETGTNWCTGASEDEGDYIVGYWTFGLSHPSTYIATTPNGYPALDSSD